MAASDPGAEASAGLPREHGTQTEEGGAEAAYGFEIVSRRDIICDMIPRYYTPLLGEYLETFPVVALVGSRQVGKSTLVLQPEIGEGRRYVTLDDISARSAAEEDPEALLSWSDRLTIDEVQLVPELLRGIKQRVDRDRAPGRFLVTGSADLNTCVELSATLAGRVGVLRLPPLTCFERQGARGVPLWAAFFQEGRSAAAAWSGTCGVFDWQRLAEGGFPLSVTAESWRQRMLWFESFRSTYLERDLRRISDIGNLTGFARLMERSATRTAQVLNQAGLGRSAGLNAATTGRYLSILEASFLIRRLQPFFANIGKRLVKSPKLYWTDTGLVSHLLGVTPEDVADGHRIRGALFETAVMQEVAALLPPLIPGARLFYVRSHDGLEVDGLIQRGSRRVPFEVKASTTLRSDDAASVMRWLRLSKSREDGMILYPGTDVKPLTSRVWAVPFLAAVEARQFSCPA